MVNPTALTSLIAHERQRGRPERPVLHRREPAAERPRDAGRRVDARPSLPSTTSTRPSRATRSRRSRSTSASMLPARYDVDWTTTPGVLRIQDALGFNLTGLTANGISQNANAAATITRIQTAKTTSNADVTFTSVTVTPRRNGGGRRDVDARHRRHRLRQADLQHGRPAGVHHRPDPDRVGARRPGLGRDARAARRSRSRARRRSGSRSASPARRRRAPRRSTGRRPQNQAPVITWTTERFELPATLRQGEKWTIQITGGASAERVVTSTDTADTFAQALAAGLGTGASFSNGTVTYENAAGFTANITVTPVRHEGRRRSRRRLADDEDRDARRPRSRRTTSGR